MKKIHPLIAACLIIAILVIEFSFSILNSRNALALSAPVYITTPGGIPLSPLPNTTVFDGPRTKKEILDFILKKTVNIISAVFLRSLTAWVRSGFNGQPQFVKDPERFLKNLLQNGQINHQLQLLATELCSPLGGGKGGGVTVKSPNISGYPKLRCTINHPNLANFFDRFDDGGWKTWDQLLLPQNNIYGMLAIGSDLRGQEQSKKVQQGNAEYIASQGFLGIKQCAVAMSFATTVGGKNYTSQNCADYHNVTPGSVVATKIQEGLTADFKHWINASAFTDMIAVLLDSVLNNLIGTKFMCLSCAGKAAPATTVNVTNTACPTNCGACTMAQTCLTPCVWADGGTGVFSCSGGSTTGGTTGGTCSNSNCAACTSLGMTICRNNTACDWGVNGGTGQLECFTK